MVVGSPPCRDLPQWNVHMNHPKMDPEEVKRRRWEAETHLAFCAEIYEMQVREGRHFLHEHPQTAVSWQLPVITRLLDLPGVATTVAHMCRYGMMQPDEHGEMKYVKKPTRWMSSAKWVLRRLSKTMNMCT